MQSAELTTLKVLIPIRQKQSTSKMTLHCFQTNKGVPKLWIPEWIVFLKPDDQPPHAFTKSNSEFRLFTNSILIQDWILDVVS